jgi:hypothetical protein
LLSSSAQLKQPLLGARWALVMWNAFLKASSGDCKMANLSAPSLDRTAKQALSPSQVAAELLSTSEVTVENPYQALISSLRLTVLVAHGVNFHGQLMAENEVAGSLKSIDELLQKLFSPDRAIEAAMTPLRIANLIWRLENVVTSILSYFSALITVVDNIAFHGRSMENLDAAVLMSVTVNALVVGFQTSLSTVKYFETRSKSNNGAGDCGDALQAFIKGALKTDQFVKEFTSAQKQLTLCTGAAYIPHLAVRSAKNQARAATRHSSNLLDDYVGGVEDDHVYEEFDADREQENDDEGHGIGGEQTHAEIFRILIKIKCLYCRGSICKSH